MPELFYFSEFFNDRRLYFKFTTPYNFDSFLKIIGLQQLKFEV